MSKTDFFSPLPLYLIVPYYPASAHLLKHTVQKVSSITSLLPCPQPPITSQLPCLYILQIHLAYRLQQLPPLGLSIRTLTFFVILHIATKMGVFKTQFLSLSLPTGKQSLRTCCSKNKLLVLSHHTMHNLAPRSHPEMELFPRLNTLQGHQSPFISKIGHVFSCAFTFVLTVPFSENLSLQMMQWLRICLKVIFLWDLHLTLAESVTLFLPLLLLLTQLIFFLQPLFAIYFFTLKCLSLPVVPNLLLDTERSFSVCCHVPTILYSSWSKVILSKYYHYYEND